MRFIQHSEKERNSEQGEYALMYPCFSASRLLALPLRGPLLSAPSALHLAYGRPACLYHHMARASVNMGTLHQMSKHLKL